jgi:hypothetical protein
MCSLSYHGGEEKSSFGYVQEDSVRESGLSRSGGVGLEIERGWRCAEIEGDDFNA